MLSGVVRGGGAVVISAELFRQRAHVARAEADDHPRIVEVIGADVDQSDLPADLACRGDDELQQPARRRF